MSGSVKRDYFNELAPRWDEILLPPEGPQLLAAFCARACPGGVRRVLDIGSGTGLLVPFLLARLGAQAHIIELDFAHAMLRLAVRRSRDPRLAAVCADALALPFPPALFDLVIAFGVLPHLGPARSALSRLWQAVAPGGLLAIGHLASSEEINARHRSIGGPVGADYLPPAGEVAAILVEFGAQAVEAEDSAGCYYIRARKGSR